MADKKRIKELGKQLTKRQKKFVDEYVKGGCTNEKLAAIKAGYSKASAYSIASENLRKPKVCAYMTALTEDADENDEHSAQDLVRRMWEVVDGTAVAEEIVYESKDGKSIPKRMLKGPAHMDRLKAMEFLAKCHGLFLDKHKQEMDRERLELEKERLELEKKKVEEGSTDKDVTMVIEGYEEEWSV